MLKGKLKAKKKVTEGRSKAMDDEHNSDGPEEQQPPDQGDPGDAPTPPPDQSPDQPPASGDPGEDAGQSPAPPASPVDRSLVLMVAAIMYTKPGPGSVRDAYQHAKNLIEMLDEDEAADKNAP